MVGYLYCSIGKEIFSCGYHEVEWCRVVTTLFVGSRAEVHVVEL